MQILASVGDVFIELFFLYKLLKRKKIQMLNILKRNYWKFHPSVFIFKICFCMVSMYSCRKCHFYNTFSCKTHNFLYSFQKKHCIDKTFAIFFYAKDLMIESFLFFLSTLKYPKWGRSTQQLEVRSVQAPEIVFMDKLKYF